MSEKLPAPAVSRLYLVQDQQGSRPATRLTCHLQEAGFSDPDSPDTLYPLHDYRGVWLPGQFPFQRLDIVQIDKRHLVSPVQRSLNPRVIRDGDSPARAPMKSGAHG